MWKNIYRFLKRIEERRRAANIFKLGRYESYKQKHIKEMAVYILYEANKKLWSSGLPEQTIGEILLKIGKIVHKHQQEFSKGVKGIFANYEILKKLDKADPVHAIQYVRELQTEHEYAMKREINALLKAALPASHDC